MVLEGIHTQVVMMMMVVVMAVVIQRRLLATNQGRGASSDFVDRQTYNIFFFSFFLFVSMYICILSFI